jgi:hypothetical protein
MTQDIVNAVNALQKVAQRIRRIEQEAREALFEKDDPVTHRKKLEQKTIILMELPDLVGPYCQGLDKATRSELEKGLDPFAISAERASDLASIFYMNALLYPEDYKEGDPNDLERFIDRFRAKHLPDLTIPAPQPPEKG